VRRSSFVQILAFDTATPATSVALGLDDGRAFQRRHDPAPGERPGHQAMLLQLVTEVLDEARISFARLDRIAVGIGPGTFTGLRIGVATARGLASAHDIDLVGVSTLQALALLAADERPPGTAIVPVLDARRGEAFAAAWKPDEVGDPHATPLLAPAALLPDALVAAVAALPRPPLAVGDGALRFRQQLEAAGAVVPAEGDLLHRVDAAAHMRLGAAATPAAREDVLPAYLRLPDAELALRQRRRSAP